MSAELLAAADDAAQNAYAPYSNFFVGAVARARDGRLFTGVNVENAAYPLGICAERCCIGAAATAGLKPGDLEEIAITASPCGGCRQWLAEWKLERVTYRRENGEVATVEPADLLPDSFVL
jgi:cytidine deaminase